jgi:hypothetical protein
MAIVPVPRVKKIDFFQTRLAPWAAHWADIGLDEDDVTVMDDLVAAARSARLAQAQARDAARSATLRYRTAIEKMCGHGSDCIKKIKARAAAVGGDYNGVYALSLIPPAADPSPLPPPGEPTRFRVGLRQDGTLELRWACKNPKGSQGTMYEVWRQRGFGQPFEFLATVGVKKFVDEKIPAGTTMVIYRVVAVRSTRRGAANTYNVQFGVNSGGAAMPATVVVRRAA